MDTELLALEELIRKADAMILVIGDKRAAVGADLRTIIADALHAHIERKS